MPKLYDLILKARAQVTGGGINIKNPLGDQTIIGILEKVSGYLIWVIAPPIAAIMVIYGAFLMLTSAGDPEKFATGRKAITYAAVGYGIILASWGILSLIKELLGVK